MTRRGWIGVDLDGTLAFYEKWIGPTHIGEPIPSMVRRVKAWLADGWEVRIFTARVSLDDTEEREKEAALARLAIAGWCERHLGRVLVVTNVKDYEMVELRDDRAVQVIANMGEPVGESTRGLT